MNPPFDLRLIDGHHNENRHNFSTTGPSHELANEIRSWLSPVEAIKRHKDVKAVRVDGTGRWFVETPQFQTWRDGNDHVNRVLCCYGISGSGKTVITYVLMPDLTMVDVH
jgi:hypothetical protein